MGFAAGAAGFSGDIISAEDGVVFVKIGEMIVFVDASDNPVHRFGNGKVIVRSDPLDLIGAKYWSVFYSQVRQELEFLLDSFADGFR